MSEPSINKPESLNISLRPAGDIHSVENNQLPTFKKPIMETNKVTNQKDVTIDLSQFLEPIEIQENKFINFDNNNQ